MRVPQHFMHLGLVISQVSPEILLQNSVSHDEHVSASISFTVQTWFTQFDGTRVLTLRSLSFSFNLNDSTGTHGIGDNSVLRNCWTIL